ncbi:MAG: hypothetical protein WBD53_07725 [Xanthobacteraceae bacterium]
MINTTRAFLGLCAAAGVVAWGLSGAPLFAIAAVGILAVVLVVFLMGTWRFADRHPDQAALGGSSWLKFRQLQMEAKDAPELVPLPPTTDPKQPLPSLPQTNLLSAPDDD